MQAAAFRELLPRFSEESFAFLPEEGLISIKSAPFTPFSLEEDLITTL